MLSPDDRTLYMAANPLSSNQVSFDNLYRGQYRSTNRERTVFSLPSSRRPPRSRPPGVGLALSPDGGTLAVVAWNGVRDPTNRPERSEQTLLFAEIRIDGRNYQVLRGPFTNDTLAKVAWSRNGRTIHFVQSPFDQKVGNLGWQLWSLPVNGGKPHFAGLSLETLRPDWITTGAATDPPIRPAQCRY